MWSAAKKFVGALFKEDTLLWNEDLIPHATGELSMAVVQANQTLEDQCQVYTSANSTLVGVYDGHGGVEASRFVNARLLRRLVELEAQHAALSNNTILQVLSEIEQGFLKEITSPFLDCDPYIVKVGSCCIVGVITPGSLIVANLGDSRAVLGNLSRFGALSRMRAERLSRDHNARDPDIRREVETRQNNPGVVSMVGGVWRVGGADGIQVSRSIGDYSYKQATPNNGLPLLSAEPEIRPRTLGPDDKFVIFATDGLWDQLDDAVAVKIVSTNPRRGIAKKLVQAAVEKAAHRSYKLPFMVKITKKGERRRIHDDISVVVVFLDRAEPQFDAGSTYTSCPLDISTNLQ